MKAQDRIAVRVALMEQLDWPVTTGEVGAAAEQAVEERWREHVVAATRRLPDDGTWTEIDALWHDLDPLLKDVVHST